MYYYGYNGGYTTGNSVGYNTYPGYSYGGYSNGYGFSAAMILVLFILLVVIFGAGFLNGNNNCCNNQNNCNCGCN